MKTLKYHSNRIEEQISIDLPASKSLSNRALILQHLFPGRFDLKNLSQADDTRLMQTALNSVEKGIYAGNAGTVLRFLCAFFAQQNGKIVELSGDERLHQRPLRPLVEALRQLGAQIEYLGREGFAPVKITGKKLTGKRLKIDTSESSQFVSALMLIAPAIEDGLQIEIDEQIPSLSYIHMTANLMNKLGFFADIEDNIIRVSYANPDHKKVPPLMSYHIEPDWSSAAFWYEMVALNPNLNVLLKGISLQSLQGDKKIAELMQPLGIISEQKENGLHIYNDTERKKHPGIADRIDFSQFPDLVPCFTVSAAALGNPCVLTGIKNLAYKESNRLLSLRNELGKFGYPLKVNHEELVICKHILEPQTAAVKTYQDHRVAMAFAPLAFVFGKLMIDDADCVVKSYPKFWEDTEKAGLVFEN